MRTWCATHDVGVAGGIISEFTRTLKDLAKLRGKIEYQSAQYSGVDPTFVRLLCDGEKQASNRTVIRLTITLVMDPDLARKYPALEPYIVERTEGRTAERRDCRVPRVSESEPLDAL